MTHEEILTKLRDKFGADAFTTSDFRDNRRLLVSAEGVFGVLEYLKQQCGFDLLAELGGADYLQYPDAKDRYGVWYVLVNTTTGRRLIVKTFANDPEPSVPSVFSLWKGADWMEREVYDMYGVVFDGHPDLRRILMPDEFTAFPLRKDYPMRGKGERHNFPVITRAESEVEGEVMPLELADVIAPPEGPEKEYLWTLNFGPQHPATHTTLRLILTLDGETIVKAVPDIGYLHSGFEKLGEHLDYNQYVTIVDRMNYISPVANEIAWHYAVEKLMDIDLTPRCKYIRTIFNELMRIHDHLLCCGAAALDLGGFTAFLYAFNQKEKIYDICERAAGQRFHPSYTRVGGLLRDVDETWIEMVRAFVREFPKAWNDVVRLLNRNRIFIERTKDVGKLTKEDANNLSCTGPIARASGVVRDLRKDEPYLAYKDFDFKVVCAREGDCYARYLVRMEEMLESCKIIHQAIENLPSGPVNVDVNSKVVMPNQLSVYRSIEGLIQHFELIMTNRQWHTPVDEVYAAIESPNGELGYYIIADGSGVAYRARTRPPSFIHFAIFPYLIVGHQVSDVVAVLGSLNIIAAELDR